MKKVIYTTILLIVLAGAYVVFNSYVKKPNARVLKQPYVNNNIDREKCSQLAVLGFTKIQSVKSAGYNEAREMYSRQYGLTFLGDEEMTDFLRMNDFIIGPSERYLEEIPKTAVSIMWSNYNKLKLFGKKYQLDSFNDDWRGTKIHSAILSDDDLIKPLTQGFGTVSESELPQYVTASARIKYNIPYTPFNLSVLARTPIYVIAAANKFDTQGMTIEEGVLKANPPRDPIAVVKVEQGWVQIANW